MTVVSEEVSIRLGEAIRTQRRRLGLTLVDVASRAALSHPFLSQLERGMARPSMRSLTAIAAALETTAQALLAVESASSADPAVESVSIVRHDPGRSGVESPGGTVRSLVKGERSMLPVEFTGAPKAFHEYFSHPGEEFVYVVRGSIEIDVDGDLHPVSTGECVYYAGHVMHRWRSTSRTEVRLVVVQQNH
jgi:quercetin dioxygenase-like cupin family protein